MSLPPSQRLGASGPRRARLLLVLGTIALLASTIAPATAAGALKPARFAARMATKTPTARPVRKPGTDAGSHLAGRPRPGKRVGKPRRPALPPLLTIPVLPPGGGNGDGVLPHRAERAPPHHLAQSPSVPRQLLIVLHQNQANDIANELARRHGLERKQSQRMELLNGRCELYEL